MKKAFIPKPNKIISRIFRCFNKQTQDCRTPHPSGHLIYMNYVLASLLDAIMSATNCLSLENVYVAIERFGSAISKSSS